MQVIHATYQYSTRHDERPEWTRDTRVLWYIHCFRLELCSSDFGIGTKRRTATKQIRKKLEMVLWSKELSVFLLWYAWQRRRSLENCGWKRDMLHLVFTGCFVSVFCVKISLIDRKWTDLSHAVASGSNQSFHTGDLLLGYVICAARMIEFDKFPWNKLICLYRSEKDFLLFLIYFFILNVKVL